MLKLKGAIIVFISFLIMISVFTVGFPQTIAPFCFPTEGTLGWRFNEGTHKGIDIWTGDCFSLTAKSGLVFFRITRVRITRVRPVFFLFA